MKEYNVCFPEYGQCTAGRIAYWEKIGVAKGIVHNLEWHMYNKKMKLSDWTKTIDAGNGKTFESTSVTVVIPTSASFSDVTEGHYPHFVHCGKLGVIDMINFGGELQFHIMYIDYKEKRFVPGSWHTIREGLDLQYTCVLYEYIMDRLKDLIILPMAENGKYNATGALGVGINDNNK